MENQATSRSVLRSIATLFFTGFISTQASAVSVYVESTTYAWSGDVFNPQSDSYSGPGLAAVSAYATNYDPWSQAASAASAGSGSVAAVTTASITGPDYTDQMEAVSEALARMTIDDMVFDGAGSTVNTTLNLDWSGSMLEILMPQNFETYGIATNTLSISGRLFSDSTTYIEFEGSRIVSIDKEDAIAFPNEVISSSGILEGVWPASGGDLVTDSFMVPTDTPVSLELSLFTRSTVGFYLTGSDVIEGTAYTRTDFGHTLSLNTDGEVFNLLAGETVNSISGDITNNAWTGVPVSATVVPIPAAVYLFSFGLLLLGGYARREN